MVKKILFALSLVLIIAATCIVVWFFFLKPAPLKGDVNNSHVITLNLYDNVFYDLYIPNEAVLEKTDEHYTYEYDLLKVGVRDTDPLDADYKIQVDGRWVYAYSSDDWLKTIAYSVEHNLPYEVNYEFEYLTYIDEETGEEMVKDWACGPYPASTTCEYIEPGVYIYGDGDYLIYKEQYGQYRNVMDDMFDRLVQYTGRYMCEYYNDYYMCYAADGGITVGVVSINFNTQYTVFAKGPTATRQALAILTGGMG